MSTKTPKFDAALDEVLEITVSGPRRCTLCRGEFALEEGDITFCKKLRVPPLRECPECRMRKRMAMEANLLHFYRKECAVHPGERVASQMDEASPYKIYDNDHWWNPDVWDAMKHGRPYDPLRPFDAQLVELLRDVPHMALSRYRSNVVNSEYTTGSMRLKDCYLCGNIGESENVSYGVWVIYAKDSLDLLQADHVEQSYEVVDSNRIYGSQYVQNAENCMNSQFLFDCRNCQNCFGCVNLRNKKYCFWNEQLSREGYERRVRQIDLGKRSVRDEQRRKFDALVQSKSILRAVRTKSSPNSTGDALIDCKNCFQTFAAISVKWILVFYKNKDIRWGQDLFGTEDAMDVSMFGPGQNSYNVLEGLSVNKVVASYFLDNCLEVEYSFECNDCRYCFGCSGLRKKKYCILNTQYGEDEYWATVDVIKTDMLKRHTYGEFLPLQHSFFYYHDTYAQALLPLDRESAARLGARWNENEKPVDTAGFTVLAAGQVPDSIADVTDDILGAAIICAETGKPFRITKAELEFYRAHRIPVPVIHPQARLLARFRRKNPYKLWDALCAKCGQKTPSSYDPIRKLSVYCEQCYHQAVS